jgi:hypothetical protein
MENANTPQKTPSMDPSRPVRQAHENVGERGDHYDQQRSIERLPDHSRPFVAKRERIQ